jgi:hypothetical protein
MDESRVNLGAGAPGGAGDESRVNLGAGAPGGAGDFLLEVGGYEIPPRGYIEGSYGGSTPYVDLPEGGVLLERKMMQASGKIGADIVAPGGDRFGGAVSGAYARGSTKFPEQLQRYGAPAKVTYGTRGVEPTEYRGYYEPKGAPRFEGYYRPAMPGGRPDYGISASKVFRFEEGGAAPYEMDMGQTAPGATPTYLNYMPEEIQRDAEQEEQGFGSFLWDKLTGEDPTEDLRKSARVGGTRTEALYGSDPSFMQLEDARAHMLGSAVLAKKYGPETAETVGDFHEFLGRFGPWPIGGQNARDEAMDKRNNAVGRQIFTQAGMNASDQDLTRMVDAKVFEQLDQIMGRTKEEQMTPSPGQPRAPRNFMSPPTGPDVYFPRNEQGYFDTTRRIMGVSRPYRNYQ